MVAKPNVMIRPKAVGAVANTGSQSSEKLVKTYHQYPCCSSASHRISMIGVPAHPIRIRNRWRGIGASNPQPPSKVRPRGRSDARPHSIYRVIMPRLISTFDELIVYC